MADPFSTMVNNLEHMGFFQYLFPFLLAFAILYGMLNWVFKGKMEPRVNALIAVIISFFVMLYSAYNTWLYEMLTAASGIWLGMATVLLFIVVLAALAGVNLHEFLADSEGKKNWLKYVIILVIVYVVLVSVLGSGVYWFTNFLPYSGSDLWTVGLVILILALIFWFVGGEDKGAGGAAGQKQAHPGPKPG